MKKGKFNTGFCLLFFLALFGLSIGVFDNYRDLWMSSNGLSTVSISHVKSVSNVVTVLALFYFTLRVPIDKLKKGMTVVLVLKMMCEVILLVFDGREALFAIKFLMFFDIAFTQLILSSVYPLMMNFAKDDEIYTKKGFVESFFDKIGFLFVSLIVGKVIFGRVINYNTCLSLCLLFTFLSFVVLITIEVNGSKTTGTLNVKDTLKYFKENKVFLFFLGHNLLGSVIWATIVGMPMLMLTQKMTLEPQMASFLILGLGVVSTVMSMVVLKYLRFKNDQYNLIFKFGIRVIAYALCVITNDTRVLFGTIVYLLLTNSTHNFIFSSFFVNNIDEKYSLIFTTLKYCTSLLGDAIGIFILGLFFDSPVRLIALPAVALGIVHYVLACVLVEKKKALIKLESINKTI